MSQTIHRLLFPLAALLCLSACAQKADETVSPLTKLDTTVKIAHKMKVEIWSDVMCPFCYIGKRKFESAMAQFAQRQNIEIEWKSFQLNPSMKTEPGKNISQYLAETKGWTLEYARQMNDYVTNMAKESGLNYNFDKVVVANSFDAHRIIQMAKKQGKGDDMEERLFKAYFIEGQNTADHAVLLKLAIEVGLRGEEVKNVLEGKQFSEEVNRDIAEASALGINAVPFFVFDRKYGVSGAQQANVFLDTLNKAWAHYQSEGRLSVKEANGAACKPDGECK